MQAPTSLLNAPTELLPLVGYGKSGYSHDAASSDYDYGGSQAEDQLERESSSVMMMTNQLHHRGGAADSASVSFVTNRPDSAASVSYARHGMAGPAAAAAAGGGGSGSLVGGGNALSPPISSHHGPSLAGGAAGGGSQISGAVR